MRKTLLTSSQRIYTEHRRLLQEGAQCARAGPLSEGGGESAGKCPEGTDALRPIGSCMAENWSLLQPFEKVTDLIPCLIRRKK